MLTSIILSLFISTSTPAEQTTHLNKQQVIYKTASATNSQNTITGLVINKPEVIETGRGRVRI